MIAVYPNRTDDQSHSWYLHIKSKLREGSARETVFSTLLLEDLLYLDLIYARFRVLNNLAGNWN